MSEQHISNDDDWIENWVTGITRFMGAHSLSYCEYLIITALISENNVDSIPTLRKRLVGAPVADYLKPYFPCVSTDDYTSAINNLFERQILQENTLLRDGISLTEQGKTVAHTLPK